MRAHILPYWANFRRLCVLASLVMLALCAMLLLAPGLIHWLFGIDSLHETDVMSHLAAMLFLGLGVITFQARKAADSPLRRAVSLGVGLSMAGLLVLGIFELLRGAVGLGIVLALVPEAFLASAFLRYWSGGQDKA